MTGKNVQEVRRIALDKNLDYVYCEYRFDVLSAVPYEGGAGRAQNSPVRAVKLPSASIASAR